MYRLPSLLMTLWCPLILAWAGPGTAAEKNVLVLLSKDQPEYQEVASSLRQTLTQHAGQDIEVNVVTLADGVRRLTENTDTLPSMIVTVGTQAAKLTALQHASTPILHTLLPRQAYLDLARERTQNRTRRHTAIYVDQPLRRQFNLVGFALPEHTRVAVILGPATASLENELVTAARDRDLALQVRHLSSPTELIPQLNEILEESDALLSLPDPMVFNSNTLHHLLIATYHRKVPVVGFSRAFVEAGALLAVYSTPAQTGRQAAEIVRQALQAPARPLPPPQYPRYFAVAVNRRVAASLGLDIPDEQTLLNRLQDRPE
ncbi:MAG: hypothetical protein EPN55_13730 [Gammaproteobacteria bacterium]|nr:MAG: hypothetical protein EPN55_13730 [Gammaproteobacteria bacterium]